MKLKLVALAIATVMVASLVGCGSSNKSNSTSGTEVSTSGDEAAVSNSNLNYADIELGTSYTDVTATIKFLTCRTDQLDDDYAGTKMSQYIEDFNKMYPNITIEVEGVSNYADDALLRLQGGDWGDIMMIPAVDKADLSTYFIPYGDLETMSNEIRFATTWEYDNKVYGVPCDGTAQGIVYNKKVFEKAGITELPKTTEDFIADLQLIKDNTDAIPLYTNYAAEWTMGSWDAFIGGNATGQTDYMNQELLHTAAPFADQGDGTHAYNVYKVLYDAVAGRLTEDDYSTTDWEGCKGMINNGEIGCMALGSWAVSQMQGAGDNGADIGYMPFPISVNGKQYATAGGDYSYGINTDDSVENKEASMVFVKWMTEESGYAYNEGGIPTELADDNYPEVYSAFSDCELLVDDPAISGEEDLLNALNSDSELMINNGGNAKVMSIVEHATNGDESFDDLMKEWNQAWSDAQTANDIEVTK